MSRKPFIATPALRKKVHSLAAVGTPQEDIARIIGCTGKTLRKHFRYEINVAAAEANAAVIGALFKSAMEGNLGAQIFWAKTKLGFKSSSVSSIPDPGDDPPPTFRTTTIIIPDNGRDPEMVKRYMKRNREFEIARHKWVVRQN